MAFQDPGYKDATVTSSVPGRTKSSIRRRYLIHFVFHGYVSMMEAVVRISHRRSCDSGFNLPNATEALDT